MARTTNGAQSLCAKYVSFVNINLSTTTQLPRRAAGVPLRLLRRSLLLLPRLRLLPRARLLSLLVQLLVALRAEWLLLQLLLFSCQIVCI